MRSLQRVAMAAALACALTLALGATASASPKPGKYTGSTSEKGAVTFTVSANGQTVLDFSAQDGYNRACHFSGGMGGIRTFTVAIASMAVAEPGAFSGTVAESDRPFRGTTTLEVKGKLTGPVASGTVTALGRDCGAGSPTPKASMYLETFRATKD